MATAKFDIKTEATRPLLAGVGVTDLAVERVRGYVADVQKRLADLDLEPRALREQARAAVSTRVEALSKDAAARRSAIESRVAELQDEAKSLPTRVQAALNDNVIVFNTTYADLAKRGEVLVSRIRRQEATQDAVAQAETTVAKAKATRTTATKTAKKSTATAKKAATATKSSAKATGTAAKKAAASSAAAATDAAEKVGD